MAFGQLKLDSSDTLYPARAVHSAACEGFFSRLKTELFYPRDWKIITIEKFVHEIDVYIR